MTQVLEDWVRWKRRGDITDSGHKVVRVGGRQYIIQDDESYRSLRGAGSAICTVRFDNGDVVKARLQYQGVIPDEYRGLLPDNAKLGM